MNSGEAGVGWGVGARGGEGAGGCGHALADFSLLSFHLQNASLVWVVARKRGPSGVWAVGVVRARGGVGTHLAAFKYSLNTSGNASQVSGRGEETRGQVGCGRWGW